MTKVFVAYPRSATDQATKIATFLDQLPDIDPYFDTRNLDPGLPFDLTISSEIHTSRFFVCVLDRAGLGRTSSVLHQELRLAEVRYRSTGSMERYAIPCCIDDCRDLLPQWIRSVVAIQFFDPTTGLCTETSFNLGLRKLRKALINALDQEPIRSAEAVGSQDTPRPVSGIDATVTCHSGVFDRDGERFFFVSIRNHGAEPLSVSHVHYEDPYQAVYFMPRSRTLPIVVGPHGSWETWVPVKAIDAGPEVDPYECFRVQFQDRGETQMNSRKPMRLPHGGGDPPGGPIDQRDVDAYPEVTVVDNT